jgi:predicted nucleic acid-binding protein
VILCDTSYLGVTARATARPELIGHWPADVLERLDNAILSVSPFTIAEERYGRLKANWNPTKAAAAEQRLSRFPIIPLDMEAVDEFARLRVLCERNGQAFGIHDLWIASIAVSRGIPLVSCDENQCNVPGLDAIHLPPVPVAVADPETFGHEEAT